MATRDSDTSLWLHNKLGTSNDSWISGSICSQLNKEVLRNIKECFPDLQTQVKLKLLLSFFHIPRRLVEEWKNELDEIIEVAGLDSELWVAMIAETMKTLPATGSLNTEIADYEDTRPIFTDMVNDLRKLVSKHSDLGMLPLECQYLNKSALVSVVGQQPNAVKHFSLKKKPKSAALRADLLHKSAEAQTSIKKSSAPTIPLRSRGMPRKMTDTTPLKGIPSRMPTSGFRSPNIANNQQRPNMSRTSAGRKDGGIKLLEYTEQPLGYAAAKKRKREQQLEEQQKKQEQKLAAAALAAGNTSPQTPTTQNATISNDSVVTTPPANVEIKQEKPTILVNQNTDTEKLENKPNIIPKIEPGTPTTPTPFTPTKMYTEEPEKTTIPETKQNETKTPTRSKAAHIQTSNVLNSTNSNVITTTTTTAATTPKSSKLNNNNSGALKTHNHHTPKRIKQEIEIKSEEILVPAAIKVEPVEVVSPQKLQIQQQAKPIVGRQQRVIIQQQQPIVQQQQQQPTKHHVLIRQAPQQQRQTLESIGSNLEQQNTLRLGLEKTTTNNTLLTQQQIRQAVNPLANLPNNISVKITSTKSNKVTPVQQQQQPILINNSTPVILAASPVQPTKKTITTASPTSIKSLPLSQLKTAANSGPVIISQTIIQPAKRGSNSNDNEAVPSKQQHQRQQNLPQTQYILTTPQQQQQQTTNIPNLTSFTQMRPTSNIYQQNVSNAATTQTPTKILLKTSGTSTVMMTPLRQQTMSINNPPPLISTSSGTEPQQILKLQNVQLPNRPVTIQPASQAAQQQHLQAQLQQQQHTIVANNTATQQPKLTQVLVQPNQTASALNPNSNVKNKTIILTQKGVILRNIGGDMYQQIPISNMGSLQNLTGTGTTIMTTAAGPPGLVKQTTLQPQTVQLQQPASKQQLPTLIPTNQHMIVQQTPTNIITNQTTQQTIIRPVISNVQSNITSLPQGLTLIQRPGQQPQLVQVQTTPATSQPQLQRTIITQPAQQTLQQIRPQHIVVQHKPATQRLITTTTNNANTGASNQTSTQQIHIQQQSNQNVTRNSHIVQVQQQPQQTTQRKGLTLSNEHVHKAHEMFRKANRVSRPDKALILGFMAGMRENPRPNSENVIIIKLGDSEEKVKQEDGTTALCLVESLIRLDYNTGEWKTFQNYRRLDQEVAVAGQTVVSSHPTRTATMQQQNSVIIQ